MIMRDARIVWGTRVVGLCDSEGIKADTNNKHITLSIQFTHKNENNKHITLSTQSTHKNENI
jgi:hypothetical protein